MKGSGKAKSTRIDLGLAIMFATCPRTPHSQREIAEYCGCNKNAIARIEAVALRKLRKALNEYYRLLRD